MTEKVRERGVVSGKDATCGEIPAKQYVLDRIARDIQDYTGSQTGAKTFAKRILNTVTEAIFETVVRDGSFRFSGGLGVLKVKKIKTTTRRVPATGALIVCPARNKIAYVEGKTTKALANTEPVKEG